MTNRRIALPLRMQGACIDRVADGWILWLHTKDQVHGTYLHMLDDGTCNRVIIRADEGPEIWNIME